MGSLCVSVACLVAGIIVNSQNSQIVAAEQPEQQKLSKQESKFVMDVTQFSLKTPSELTKLIGESESVNEWEFSSPNGNKYKAKTYSYENGNKEFLVIDNKVVRLTLNETGFYTSTREALEIFGVKPNPEFIAKVDNDLTMRYLNISEGVDEFWLISDGKGKVTTLKVTYDKSYFE
ncbi:hypothetical protein [Brevibacillus borstelensis]|uniref:hypothetical protein n=1 Tax=Brevibacillus borstelensis TaxID=45462 RepID=UPI0030C548E2